MSVTGFANTSNDRMSLLKQLWGVTGWLDNDGLPAPGYVCCEKRKEMGNNIDMGTG